MDVKLGGVLLCSGFGRRYGGNKLLAPVDGVSLIQRAMDALPAALFTRTAAVSQYGEILDLAKRSGYDPVENPLAGEGISASLRLGLEHCRSMDGVLFAVCDQPWLRRESVEALISHWRRHPEKIAALSAEGRRGNPVIFPRALFPQLEALRGDAGGSRVVRRYPHLLTTVDIPARELEDMDTPADFSD